MAQDLREAFKKNRDMGAERMPEGHEARFLRKLEQELPVQNRSSYYIMKIAASVVLMVGLTFGAYQLMQKPDTEVQTSTSSGAVKSLGDVSPALKKVEDYYMANINMELANVKLTPENKDLFDSYLLRLEELNNEYRRLSKELTDLGPTELTVNALIDNLKLRLNLLYRLKEQLHELRMEANQNVT